MTGGKAYKTGMVLATSEIAATRERQEVKNTLLSKGRYRDAEKVAREASVGTLKTASMPKKRNADGGAEEHQTAFYKWMRSALGGKVRAGT